MKFREFEGGSWRSFPARFRGGVVDMKFREFEGGGVVFGGVFRPISTGDSGVRSNQSNPPSLRAWITGGDFLGW